MNLLLCHSHSHCGRVGEDPNDIHKSSAAYPVDDPPVSTASPSSLWPPSWWPRVVSTGGQTSSTLWNLAWPWGAEQDAHLPAAQSRPGKPTVLPVILKHCKCCHNNSSAAPTLASTQMGKLGPSGSCGPDGQCMAERSPSFHHANRTFLRRLLLVFHLGWDLGF